MSKQLMEQLAKLIYMQWIHSNGFVPWVDGGNSFKQDEARKIAKEFIEAYQAAAPIDNVAEALEKAALIAEDGIYLSDGDYVDKYGEITVHEAIRALIPSTQAKKGE
jgi:hypothetical protein